MFATERTETRIGDLLPEAVPGRVGVAGVAFAVFLVGLGLSFGISFVVGLVVGLSAATGNTGVVELFQQFGWTLGLFVYVIWVAVSGVAIYLLEVPVDVSLPDAEGIATSLAGLVGVLLVAVGAEFGLSALGYGELFQSVDPSQSTLVLVGSVLVLLAAAPAEELFFRGTIQGILRDRFSTLGAVLGANLLFVPLHLFNTIALGPVVTLVNLVVILLLGTTLGLVYDRYRNLALPVAIHLVYNAVVVGVAFLA